MADSWLQRFEERLELLERQTDRVDANFAGVTHAAQDAVAALANTSTIELWLVRSGEAERLVAAETAPIISESDLQTPDGNESRFLTSHAESASNDSDSAETYLSCSQLADEMQSVLAVRFGDLVAPRSSFPEAVSAVLSVVNGFVSRHMLSQYEARLQQQATLVHIASRLHQSQTFREAAGVVVQDGAALIDDCRLGVLAEKDSRPQVVALTGVRDPEPEAESVRAIAAIVSENPDEEFQAETNTSDATSAALETLRAGGVTAIRHLPLRAQQTATDSDAGHPELWLSIESFSDAFPDESLIRQLAGVASPVLHERRQQEIGFFRRLVNRRFYRRAIIAACLLAFLAVFPVPFEVEVPGQLASTDRRRIFAPDDGTIDRVLFENESSVKEGATLLQLSNSDLDLTQRQLEGRISTGVTELASIESQRLVADDPALSRRQKQLSEEVKNLKDQLDIVVRQSEQLTVAAPFSGRVFRSNAEQELISRPVQRGQLLLEIVPEDSGWQLDLKIPDRLRAYVIQYRDSADSAPEIRYMVMSSPEHNWQTTLTSVEDAIQIENGKLVCRAAAELEELPDIELKPGTSVTARIQCGRRSLGFVMFREVIEFWWWIKFAWL